MSEDDDKGNVVDFLKHVSELQEDDPGYVPEDEDIESFLKVLDFVRTLSITNDGRIEFDSDSMKVILVSYITDETFGEEGLVTKRSALHKEVEMDFLNITNTESEEEEEVNTVSAVEDFNDMLSAIAESYTEDGEDK